MAAAAVERTPEEVHETDVIVKEKKQVGTKEKDVDWYFKDIKQIPRPIQQLFEDWSGLRPDEVKSHILKVRDEAWDVWPYPCIGMFFFLDLGISELPLYPTVLKRLKNNEKLLDLGCCFGQDVRKLVYDGVPAENVNGGELHGGFIDVGYKLFRDKHKLRSNFFQADIFDTTNEQLNALKGKMNIIYTGSFFHLWNWADQVTVACRLVELMPAEEDSVVLGRQAGNIHPGEIPHRINKEGTMYQHDPSSWKKLWEEVGERTGTSWRVEATFSDREATGQGKGFASTDTRILLFAVYRRNPQVIAPAATRCTDMLGFGLGSSVARAVAKVVARAKSSLSIVGRTLRGKNR